VRLATHWYGHEPSGNTGRWISAGCLAVRKGSARSSWFAVL